MTTLNYLSNYRRYCSKILPGKYDPEVVPVIVHVQYYTVDPSDVFVRRQQVNSQQVTLARLTSKAEEEGFKVYI